LGHRKFREKENDMRRTGVSLVMALAVVACGASCGLYSAARNMYQHPHFGVLTGAISDAYGDEYGALAKSFFRVLGTQSACYVYAPPNHPHTRTLQPRRVRPEMLQVEFDLLKEVARSSGLGADQLCDGDMLISGNVYRLYFRANQDCYAYLVRLDSAGMLTPIFPKSQWTSDANPVKANRDYFVPARNSWLTLDGAKGIEHIFLVASTEPKTDLEKVLGKIIVANMTLRQQQRFALPHPVVTMRDVRGVWPSDGQRETRLSDGITKATFNPLVLTAEDKEMVETRWFYHR
jgi:hypothetical protein